MMLLSHSAWEIWRRDALEEVGALACEVGRVGGGEGRGGDVEDAGVGGTGVRSIDRVDCYRMLVMRELEGWIWINSLSQCHAT
jgi:hypothetical protein